MRVRPYLAVAAIAAVLAVTAPVRAADTLLLGGVGSSTARYADVPAITLQGTPNDDADVEQIHIVRRFAYGVAYGVTHPFHPLVWNNRPYWGGYGYYRPWYGYNRPWYGYNRPFYRPYYYGYYSPLGVGVSAYAPPGGCYSYGSIGYDGSIAAVTPLSALAMPPAPAFDYRPAEVLPLPQPGRSYRYDGSVTPPATPPIAVPIPMLDIKPGPNPAATVTRVVGQPKKKIAYPAYGEAPAKPTNAGSNSTLVKSPGQ